MKIFLEKAIFVNRAPFDRLELDFKENEIAVLSAVNGRGKTTILSHIVDAFYEIARPNFQNEFSDKQDNFYRISDNIYNLERSKPSFVYFRFNFDGEKIDYLDIRNNCTEEDYNLAIDIAAKIPYSFFASSLNEAYTVKCTSQNLSKEKVRQIFNNNLLTYFPSYRFEQPGYLTDVYKIDLNFSKHSEFTGFLPNPIEVISGLPKLANWIMDVVLDLQYPNSGVMKIYEYLNDIVTKTISSKNYSEVKLGVGPRNYGGIRVQIIKNDEAKTQVYPSIFNLSSGEASLLCMFGELLKQGDKIKSNPDDFKLDQISGIVLIDEVDKHLHIKLQKEALPKLFKLFPNVQFVVSSHSPFMSMGLAEQEDLLERSKIIDLDKQIVIDRWHWMPPIIAYLLVAGTRQNYWCWMLKRHPSATD